MVTWLAVTGEQGGRGASHSQNPQGSLGAVGLAAGTQDRAQTEPLGHPGQRTPWAHLPSITFEVTMSTNQGETLLFGFSSKTLPSSLKNKVSRNI